MVKRDVSISACVSRSLPRVVRSAAVLSDMAEPSPRARYSRHVERWVPWMRLDQGPRIRLIHVWKWLTQGCAVGAPIQRRGRWTRGASGLNPIQRSSKVRGCAAHRSPQLSRWRKLCAPVDSVGSFSECSSSHLASFRLCSQPQSPPGPDVYLGPQRPGPGTAFASPLRQHSSASALGEGAKGPGAR